jgi:hypothetical protein
VAKSADVGVEPLRRMVRAAEKDAASAAERLGGLIERSGRLLFPDVGDPLSANLVIGSHRWLAGEREETYSDWLAWILERQDDPALVLPLFGVEEQSGLTERWTVEREVFTPYGRLDLLLRHPQAGILCVEVKTESSPGEDQLERYLKWLDGQRSSLGLTLLAIDPPDKPLPGSCRFSSWKRMAQTLRAWAREWRSADRLYDAVMTLAFCGAVERNLLALGRRGLNSLRTADYLEEVLGEVDAQTTI